MPGNSHNILIFWWLTIELKLFCFFGSAHCLLLYIILLMSEEDRAVPHPSGLKSTESSHSNTRPLLAPKDIQWITEVVADMLHIGSSSASPLAISPTLPATTITFLMATDTTVSYAGIMWIIIVTASYHIASHTHPHIDHLPRYACFTVQYK